MSKAKKRGRRGAGKAKKVDRHRRSSKSLAAIFMLILTLGVVAGTRAFQTKKRPTNRQENRNSRLAPADASNPSQEFIYANGRIVAIDEASGSAGGGCTYSLNPAANANVPVNGGSFTTMVTAGTGCAWTASSNVAWITFPAPGPSGSGNGTLSYNVAASTSPSSRTGTITVQTQTLLVTQAGTSCTYSVSPAASPVFAVGGGLGSFNVKAGSGCGWTASPDPAVASWITITSPSGGAGSGAATVSFTVAANTTQSARNGVIHVADQMFLVSESGPCSYMLDQSSAPTFAASGGQGTVTITTGPTCTIPVTTNVFWVDNLDVLGTQCGLGVCGPTGTLFYHVEANPTTQPRSAIIMIGDQTFTVTQDAGCALAFTPATGLLNFPSAGSTQTVTVAESGAANCNWTATAVDTFITVNPPGTGSGANGALSLTLGMNPLTTSRSGSVDITSSSGFTYQYRVTQDGSICGYTVTTNPATNPLTINALQGGGTFTNGVNVATGSNCSWTAQSNVTWILVLGGNGGPVSFTGSSGVSFVVSANTGSTQRTGTMTIAGTTVNVIQPGSCTYSLSSSGQSFLAAASSGSFTVNTLSGCSWTASSDSSWVTITSGSSGTATGTVAYTVAANTGSGSRTATITAGGKPYAITQAGIPANCPTVSTFSGTGVYGYLEGNPSTAKWANPNAVATAKEPAGANAVFIADTDNNRIRMVYVDGPNAGQSVLIAGTGTAGYSPPGSNATTVSINGPRGLGALTNSNGVVTAIFFADTGNNMIRKLTPPSGGSGPWSIADFSGSGIAGYTDGAPGSAQFNAPQGIAVASNGTVYVADSSNSFIRALDTSGNASTYAGGPNIGMNTPVGLALSKNSGKLYVTDQGIHSIFSVSSGGSPSTRIAGSGAAGFVDATGTSAKFNSPYQLAWTTTTADGEVLYIGDRQNQRIRKLVISSNSVTTYAGSGTAGFLDSTCQSAQFHTPSGIGVGSLGEVYVADSANNRIRKVQ